MFSSDIRSVYDLKIIGLESRFNCLLCYNKLIIICLSLKVILK